MHKFCSCGSYKEIESNKSNFVYVLVHRYMLYLHAIYLCRCASKTILAVTLFSEGCVRRWSLLQDCLPVKFKDPKFMKFS